MDRVVYQRGRLATGDALAEVRIRVDGRERTTICVFGSPESVPTLSSYALAGLAM